MNKRVVLQGALKIFVKRVISFVLLAQLNQFKQLSKDENP
jgi:hypothetical protein